MPALYYPKSINTAGHMLSEHNIPYSDGSYSTFERVRDFNGNLETKVIWKPKPDKFIVEQDVWKFNPRDYSKKWNISNSISKLGLNNVYDLTTPIIFRNIYKD